MPPDCNNDYTDLFFSSPLFSQSFFSPAFSIARIDADDNDDGPMLLQVLYHVADNQLSGKLETAIQALDNITKTYYSFVNADALTTSPITPGRRYDAHLIPYGVLRQSQPALRTCYDGISENVAGLIEHILAFKATLKEVYEKDTVNKTTFEHICRSFVNRTQQVRLPLWFAFRYTVLAPYRDYS